jgi:hypothetical protein
LKVGWQGKATRYRFKFDAVALGLTRPTSDES